MLYLYDKAIVSDLEKSFNPMSVPNPVVRVVDPESITSLAAQLQNDEISFPLVAITRGEDTQIDTSLTNFTRIHKGVCTVMDTETNTLYYEKSIPIKLSYAMTVLTTNTADMDEIVRELMFKYYDMYFLTIKLPYESDRKARFGVRINADGIQKSSGVVEYLSSGQIYQTIIPLECDGCVMLHYTPVHLKRSAHEIEASTKQAEM